MRNRLGSIVDTGDGCWMVSVEGRPAESGKRSRQYQRVRGSRSDAEAALALMIVQNGGRSSDAVNITVKQLMQDLYLPSVKHLSAQTISGYKKVIKRHIEGTSFGNIKIGDLRPYDVRKWLDSIDSPGSVRNAWKTLRQGFGWACDEVQLIEDNPLPRKVRMPKMPKGKRDRLTADESREILETLRGDKLEPIIIMIICCGLRREEACALYWDDIELKTGRVNVCKTLQRISGMGLVEGPTKTGKSTRTVVLPARRLDRMRELAPTIQGPGFPLMPDAHGLRTDPDRMPVLLKKFCTENDLRYVSPTNMRHTYATLCLQAGTDYAAIAASMGHSNLSTAYKSYLETGAETFAPMTERLDDLISSTGNSGQHPHTSNVIDLFRTVENHENLDHRNM
jgi:integrase